MRFSHKQVECIPEHPDPGVLYVSKRFATAVHLCACGCGMEVVTPIKPGRWRLSITAQGASLHPSIGNWSFPCRSHYWIVSGEVCWAENWAQAKVAACRKIDSRLVDDAQAVLSRADEDHCADDDQRPQDQPMPTSLWLRLRKLFSK